MQLAIVTGSSRGLGAAMVARLLAPGSRVLGLARHADPALDTLARERGATLEQWETDLADALPAARRLQTWLAAQDGAAVQRALLINNAGVVTRPQPLRDADPAALVTALRVSLEATLLLCQAFLAATRDWRGDRRVLNVSSGLGRRAMAGSAGYCAAKAGMDHLSRCLALEEAALPNGARVVSLAPGVIDTDMQRQLREADAAEFPDRERFLALHRDGQLLSPQAAAARVLAVLERPDFGAEPVADVRG
ncbi:MAG: SDR family NAD(P)-dependent oxidoreductase [Piscinibacter sp.]|nr:SDR family NAD(P)-dependent oxidoreductase [Piscinibacter sp.]